MIVRRILLLLVAVFLGFIFEGSVWDKPIGIAFPFFIFLCLLLGSDVLLLLNTNLQPAPRSYWLFIPPLYFSVTALLTAKDPTAMKHILSLVFTFLYLALLTMTYLGGRLYQYSMFDYLRNFIRLGVNIIRGPIAYVGLMIRDIFFPQRNQPEIDGASQRFSWNIAILSFATLFFLFWWADWAFREFHIALFTPSSGGSSTGSVTPQGVLMWSYIVLGVILYAGTDSQDAVLTIDHPNQFFRRWMNYNATPRVFIGTLIPLITFTMLRELNFFRPEYFRDNNGFPATFETRYGFWALVAAAVAVFLVVCWLDHVTVFEGEQEANVGMDRLVHTMMNIILFANTAVVLFYAGYYVSTKTVGFTATRHLWYARGGLFWFGLIFLMFIGYAAVRREHEFPYAALRVTTILVGVFTGVMGLLAAMGFVIPW